MNFQSFIFNSELEFRKYVILNHKRISQIIIFEDTLESTIFFYCFIHCNVMVATKEDSSNSFSKYRKIYCTLASELKLATDNCFNHEKAIRIIQ